MAVEDTYPRMMTRQPKHLILSNLMLYGTVHALVDGACAVINFGGQAINHTEVNYFALLIVLYNVLAFGLQAPFGYLVDRLHCPSLSSAIGCLLIAASAFTIRIPLLSIWLSGIGNALFHVGGGVITVNLLPGRASIPGIYVAPGAVGLFVGTVLGGEGKFLPWLVVLLMFASSLLVLLVRYPNIDYSAAEIPSSDRFELVLILLLSSIAIRSLIGLILEFPWKTNIYLLLGLTSAVFLGKALGGIIADRLGWIVTTIPALIASALFIAFGSDYPALSIMGVLMFNMTMPVTLSAVVNMFPGNTGFAFGLTTLAIVVGAFPTFTALKVMLYNRWAVLIIILASAYMLYRGLTLYLGMMNNRAVITVKQERGI